MQRSWRHRLEVLRLPHDALHRRAAGDRPQPLRGRRIDGATRWQKFRYVKLPLLGPTIRLSVFFAVLGSFQLFDMVMPMTRGGPSDSTQTMVTFLYIFGVTRMRVGFGSAVGVVLFVICVAFAFGYKRVVMRQD